MTKSYAWGSVLLAALFAVNVQAQQPKPIPSVAEQKAQSPGLELKHRNFEFRGGGGDECVDANVLTVGTSCSPQTFSSVAATQSQAPILCNGFTSPAANDLWFSFVATGNSTTVTVTGSGDYDAVIEYFSGACGSLTSLGCIDDTFPPPANAVETGSFPTVAGTTYYIRVYYYSTPLPTDFNFDICLVSAGGGGPTPPNDQCTGAVAQNLAVGQTVTFSGDNTGATVLPPTDFVVVWESFTLSTCATVAVNYCVPGFEFDDFLVNLATQCPDVLTGLLTGAVSPDGCTLTFTELAPGTYYIPVLVDPALTPVGAYSIAATATACPIGYCSAGALEEDFEKIANVTFAGINNSSTATAGYEDFTAVEGNVEAGQSYPFSLTISDPYEADQVLVWVDLDQSESFEPGELLFSTTPPQTDDNVSGNITIPVSAATGQTRMRIRLHDTEFGGNANPCGNSTYGQVEDYTLNISGPVVTCDADAGTLSGGGNVCLEDGSASLSATADGNAVVPAGYETIYVLTEGAGLVIIDAGATPDFTVDAEGSYTIHTLVYDPATLDLSIVEFGVTTGFDVNGLLIQGGGAICASLDVAGAAFTVEVCAEPCDADAGTLSGGGVVCLDEGTADLNANADGNAVVPAGFETIYVLTEGAGLVIIDAGATPDFTVDAEGTYTIHTLVYDPATLDLSIVEFGVTTGFDVNGLLIQGGGAICASLDVAGAAFTVQECADPCIADAGTLSGGGNVCLENGSATLTATPDGNIVLPAGYETVYVLTQGAELVIVDAGADPEFTVDAIGTYTIHTLVYDPATLDLGIVEIGVTTGFDVNSLLIQGGGAICASLDVAGAAFNVEICSGIEERNGLGAEVFPNPTNGDLNVRIGMDATVVLELLDLSGRLVHTEQRVATSNEVMQLQLAGRLAQGTYVLRVMSDLGNSDLRIVVQ